MGLEDIVNFTSLGMIVIDHIHFPSGKVVENVIGGSGAYASLGARLFSPKDRSRQVGWAIRKGNDFPLQSWKQLKSWNVTLSIIQEDYHPSTKGRLQYLDSSLATKSFKYLTPTLKIRPEHLRDTRLLASSGFHFFVDPTEIVEQVAQLLNLRESAGLLTRPLIVWEPKAYSCVPDNLQTFVEALRVVDVFSANHLEIASIVGKDIPETVDLPFFEDLCAPLLEDGKYGHSTWVPGIVIRAGDQGCFVKSSSGHQTWLPAYYIPDDEGKEPSKVVDTTGAGNTFLGAFTIGLLMAPDDYIFAACAGNVGASFAVEQVGVPTLSSSEDGEEFWNGESVSARLQAYRDRVGSC